MTFIGYDMGAKAYRFMRKDNSMVVAIKCLFDEDTFPRTKSEIGTSTQNKLKISPPGINNQDQEEIYISPNPKDINHNHEDPHDKDSSDNTHSKLQESSPSEEESSESEERKSFKSMESEEEEVKDELKPEEESSDKEKSSSSHSRGGGSIPSNEKSREGSNRGDETSSESESDNDPFKSDDERKAGTSQPRRSTREQYRSTYGDKPPIEIEKDIIRSDKAWERAVNPKAKIIIK